MKRCLQRFAFANFNTKKVTNMSYIFNYCSSLMDLNVSSFNCENVKNMKDMFSYYSNLITLNLYSFMNNKLNNIEYIFSDYTSLISLDLSNFSINCDNLKSKGAFQNLNNKCKVICEDNNLLKILKEKL